MQWHKAYHQRFSEWIRSQRQQHGSRSGIFLLVLFLISFTFVGCLQSPPPPLRVGMTSWLGFSHLYLAETLHYYNEVPIRLLEYPSGSEMTQAFRNGELEVIGTSMADALILAEVEADYRVVLITDSSHGADVILSKPSITTLKDLVNRRVGIETIAVGAYLLNRSLEQVGLSSRDVQLVPLGVAEQEMAYQTGAIDALVTYEPVRSHLLETGANQLFDSSQIPDEIVDVLVVHRKVLERQRSNLETLVNGWFQAYQYSQEHIQETANQMAPLYDLTPAQFLTSLSGIRVPDLVKNQQLLSQPDSVLLKGIERLQTMMQQQNLLKKQIDSKTLLSDVLVKSSDL